MMSYVSKLRKFIVSLDIGQLDALVIFAVKKSTISEISKELANDILQMKRPWEKEGYKIQT